MEGTIVALALFLQTAVQMGTHILFATTGGILSEKVGNMNLGMEGMMIMGAAFGFLCAIITGNPILSVVVAGTAGAIGALIYAFITITLRGNQVVTGLVLTIFGTGVAGMLDATLSGNALPESITVFFAPRLTPILSKIPILGEALFNQSLYVQMSILVAIFVYLYLNKTSFGLNTCMVGENPGAADASGINVAKYKYINVVMGGFLCGLGGAYLSLVFVPRWQGNITAGAGWIAVALVIFSTWNSLKAIYASYLFGALRGIGFKMQNLNLYLFENKITISPQLLDMFPYIATILMLIIISFKKRKENLPPSGLGEPYFREER